MRRRDFITLLGGAAVAWPCAAGAQRPAKVSTIGILGSSTPAAQGPWWAAFVERLGVLGWVEGRNVAIEYRWAEGRSERYAEKSTSRKVHAQWWLEIELAKPIESSARLVLRRSNTITLLCGKRNIMLFSRTRDLGFLGDSSDYALPVLVEFEFGCHAVVTPLELDEPLGKPFTRSRAQHSSLPAP
jgi:hypothetical protein